MKTTGKEKGGKDVRKKSKESIELSHFPFMWQCSLLQG